jgi:ankyrin repeat protein
MKWLKDQGVDINVKGERFWTPMHLATHMAAHRGNLDVMKWLKDNGADINVKDNEGRTPLSLARNKDVKKWLRDNGAIE